MTAEDKAHGNVNKIKITNDHSRLKSEDIQRMVWEAGKFAEIDRKATERVEARNQLEQVAYRLQRELKDKQTLGGKLSTSDIDTLQKIVDSTIYFLDSNKEATTDELQEQQKNFERQVQIVLNKVNGSWSFSFWPKTNSSAKQEL